MGVSYGCILLMTCVAEMHLGGVAATHLRGSLGGIKNNSKELLTSQGPSPITNQSYGTLA